MRVDRRPIRPPPALGTDWGPGYKSVARYHPNRIVLVDPVFKALWKQRRLTAIDPLNKAPHPTPPQIASESYSANQITRCVFTHGVIPGSAILRLGESALE